MFELFIVGGKREDDLHKGEDEDEVDVKDEDEDELFIVGGVRGARGRH